MILSNVSGVFLKTMLYLANHTSKIDETNNEITTDVNEVKCYGVYGCFSIDYPWATMTRPVNEYPQSPSYIHPEYLVFNRQHTDLPAKIDLNDPEGVKRMGINGKSDIFLLVHGYLEGGVRPWMFNITKALLNRKDERSCTIIIVDWGAGSNPPYAQAAANTRIVGAITAHVLYMLYDELSMTNLNHVHMIGHSLGAHLSGYTGYFLQRDFQLKLGRITGLDPAEPLFADTDPLVRLDRSDAIFVDVLHTDAYPFFSGGLGMVNPIGHVDFYPNGGYNNPGCDLSFNEYMKKKDSSFVWSMQQILGCNHIRSHQFFTESVETKCPFNAITCDSFEDFKEGKCFECGKNGHLCFQFGFNSIRSYRHLVENGAIRDNRPIKAFLMTNSHKPFCQIHYRVTIKISSSDESALHGGEVGMLAIRLNSNQHTATDKIFFSEEAMLFEPGFEYTAVTSGNDVGIVKFATVSWEYQTNLLNPLTWRIVSSPRVYLDHVIIETLEYKNKIKLCPIFSSPVVAGSPSILQTINCDV